MAGPKVSIIKRFHCNNIVLNVSLNFSLNISIKMLAAGQFEGKEAIVNGQSNILPQWNLKPMLSKTSKSALSCTEIL